MLLDLHLPKEDGYNVLRQIRQTPHLGQTKVVAVTADIMNSQVERCKAAGFNGFLGKPISAERFPAQIQRLLNGEYVWEPH